MVRRAHSSCAPNSCQFQILNDHKPLVRAMYAYRTTPPWFTRQQRQMAYLAQFCSDFRHTPGTADVIAATPSNGRLRQELLLHV
jgi:hypothetical protein